MNAIPSVFPVYRDLHEVQSLTSKALVAQFEAGRKTGVRETALRLGSLMGIVGMGCFVGGIVFACLFAETVVRWLA